MNRKRSIAVVLVLSVLLAGCAGTGGSNTTSSTSTTASTTTTTTDAASSTSTTPSNSATTSKKSTTTETTTEESWSPPKPPNTPFQHKEQPSRLKSVKLVDKVKVKSGNGYSNFNVQVVANTSMKNVDPKPLVDGDPYFLVQINGKNVARKNVQFQHNKGTYPVDIDKGAFKQFDDGTLHITVYLLDEDHSYDDVYAKWTGTIQYSSK